LAGGDRRHDSKQKLAGAARTIEQFTSSRERTKIVRTRIDLVALSIADDY